MSKRRVAVTAAIALSIATLTPLAAHAASSGGATYYVSGTDTLCNDSGPGTQTEPFCTIQAAAGAATAPGDTVLIGQGTYSGEVTITASGTAADPITFEPQAGPGSVAIANSAATDEYGLRLEGASYVDVNGIDFNGYTVNSQYVDVDNSSYISMDRILAPGNIMVTGDSGHVTISRAQVGGPNRTFAGGAIEIDSSGSDNVVTTSLVEDWANGGAGITVAGSPDAAVTSNTIWDFCGAGISVGDDSNGVASGATIENNVLEDAVTDSNDEGSCTAATTAGISVQSAADESGLTANYNDVYPADSLATEAYEWAGTAYQTAAALDAATSQGAADSNANPGVNGDGIVPNESSLVINAADSNAPGELTTDFDGNARVFDPNVPETGAGTDGYDRGAVQFVEVVHAGGLTAPSTAPSGAAVTFTEPKPADNWANATFTYTYDFGDGSADVTTTAASVTHTYAAVGSYQITLTATSDYGASSSAGYTIEILKPVPFAASLALAASDGLSVNATATVTTDWPIASETINYGDGTGTVNAADSGALFHTYAVPGTYTVAYTVTDAGGDSKTITQTFTTAGNDYYPYSPTRLLDTRKGLGGTSTEISHDGSIKLKVAGVGTIPTGVTAVGLNLTVVGASGNGYIQTDTGSGDTGTSNLNYGASSVYTNSVVAAVAPDGTVTLRNFGVTSSVTLQLIADISGYYAPTATGSEYASLANSARIMDTRSGVGGTTGKLAAGKTDVLTIAGADGGALPASGITAVALNVTATGTSDAGYLTVYADGAPLPGTSNLNWQGSTTKPTAVVAPVGADGRIDIFNGSDDGGSTDVLVDVSGYYTQTTQGAVYVPITPTRLLDTRKIDDKLPANSGDQLNMNAVAGAPFSLGMGGLRYPITAYVVNATVTDTQASGWLSAGSGSTEPPATSNLNWSGSGRTTANLAYAISVPNQIQVAYFSTFYNGGGSVSRPVDLIVDVMGYFSTL